MKNRLQGGVYLCSNCGKEHGAWNGSCVVCGFKRSIRMSQANVKRFKPQVYRMPEFHKSHETGRLP